MKLGKTPARPGAVKLKFKDFVSKTAAIQVPPSFGHEGLVKDYGMLGNDKYGDCVWAGAAHETMMWNVSAGKVVTFTDASVLSDYSAVTGFNPKKPSTDQGTDMELAAKYRVKTGVLDKQGNRHKVLAYLEIEPGNTQETLLAAYMFGAVGIGIEFPESAMDQFNAGKPWAVVHGSQVDGGHYIPLVAHRGAYLDVLTWGKVQRMTKSFFTKFCDEAVVYVNDEMMKDGKSPEGFDMMALQDAFKELTGRKMVA